MKSRMFATLLLLAPALLPAQDKGGGTTIYPSPAYTEIKQYLSLTDGQFQAVQAILDNRNQAIQAIYTQIYQKNDLLYQLLNSDSGTAGQLGQLLIDIRNLQKQIPLSDVPYKAQVLAVLTAEQKAKLPKLSEVLQLTGTASEAGSLLFIDFPQYVTSPVIAATGAGSANATPRPLLVPRR